MMSRYGWFACIDCQIMVWLGKAIFDQNHQVVNFHIGQSTDSPNWQRTTLNRVIWKMLADHAGHTLNVIIEGAPQWEMISDFRVIGGDEIGDPSYQEYLGEQSDLT